MNVTRFVRSRKKIALILAIVSMQLLIAHEAKAERSNRNQVRANLTRGGWVPIWGVTINESDYIAVSASILSANPSALSAYIKNYAARTLDKVRRNADEIALEALEQLIHEAFRSNGRVLRNGRLEIKAGVATYNRWECFIYDEPATRRQKIYFPGGGWTWGPPKTYWVRKTRKIPLPNHHQPYIMFRYVDNSGGTSLCDEEQLRELLLIQRPSNQVVIPRRRPNLMRLRLRPVRPRPIRPDFRIIRR